MAITDNMMGILPSLQIKHHIIDSTPSLFMAHKPRARIGFIKCFVACFEWSMNISLIFNRNDKHINSSLCVIYLRLPRDSSWKVPANTKKMKEFHSGSCGQNSSIWMKLKVSTYS